MHAFVGHLTRKNADSAIHTLMRKLRRMPWFFLALITTLVTVGFALLYSAAAGQFDPWASSHIQRFIAGLVIFFIAALTSPKNWLKMAFPLYLGGVACLLLLPYSGYVSMGANRWLDIGLFRFQPAEIVKVGLILTLAAYYQKMSQWSRIPVVALIPPLIIIAVPAFLVLIQPDLGTTILIVVGGLAAMFVAGESLWLFALLIGAVVGGAPIAWNYLYPYQKARLFAFLDPESDPLGSGYHILQSKIAIGSGGWNGKGYMQGSQSHLDFLPEKHTDFIFTLLAEEIGFSGSAFLLLLYGTLLAVCLYFALRAHATFERVFTVGFATLFFSCVFINIAMVSGLLPVVGIPLPFLSYGGSFLISMMLGFGIIASMRIHRPDPDHR